MQVSSEIMAPVLNKPRFTLSVFWAIKGVVATHRSYIAQITTDIWQLWDDTQSWQKCLISCGYQDLCECPGRGSGGGWICFF